MTSLLPSGMGALALVSLLAAASASAQGVPADLKGKNFVVNGSFESDGNSDGSADYWFAHPAVKRAVVSPMCIWSPDGDAADGRAYLSVGKVGGDMPYSITGSVTKQAIDIFQAHKEAPLVLSAKVRGKDLTANASVILQIFARKAGSEQERFVSNVSAKPQVTGTTGWTATKVVFRLGDILMPDDTLSRLEVSLSVSSNTGHADFDAVSLTFAE